MSSLRRLLCLQHSELRDAFDIGRHLDQAGIVKTIKASSKVRVQLEVHDQVLYAALRRDLDHGSILSRLVVPERGRQDLRADTDLGLQLVRLASQCMEGINSPPSWKDAQRLGSACVLRSELVELGGCLDELLFYLRSDRASFEDIVLHLICLFIDTIDLAANLIEFPFLILDLAG